MNRLTDRLLLGMVAGVLGNQTKQLLASYAIHKKLSYADGPEVAGGMLLPAHLIHRPEGRLIGIIADNLIAGALGVTMTYALSVTGSNNSILKGAATGGIAWNFLYGVLATLGATRVREFTPKTVMTEFVAHSVYGATTAGLIKLLGDPNLFNGKIPLSASRVQGETSLLTKLLYQE